jgi:hypothetical protein
LGQATYLVGSNELGLWVYQVRWRPFYLNPAASTTGINKRQMYIEKFGQQRIDQMVPMITKVRLSVLQFPDHQVAKNPRNSAGVLSLISSIYPWAFNTSSCSSSSTPPNCCFLLGALLNKQRFADEGISYTLDGDTGSTKDRYHMW